MATKKEDWRLVALEETQYLTDNLKLKTGRFFQVYMYRHDQVTHCCEITPSYYLLPLDYIAESLLDPEGLEVEERLHEELEELTALSEPIYVHCNQIDRLPWRTKGIGRIKYKHKTKFEDQDEAWEYYRGNQML